MLPVGYVASASWIADRRMMLATKLCAVCNTRHQIIPKRILAKAKMKPEMICGKTNRGANSKVSAVSVVNRKLEMWSSPKAKQLT